MTHFTETEVMHGDSQPEPCQQYVMMPTGRFCCEVPDATGVKVRQSVLI